MADPAKVNDQNILPVQALFNLDNSFNTFIGQGQPFYATVNPDQSGLHITNSTIDSTTIGATSPSTGVFTNISTTTGTITTAPSGNTDIVNKQYVDAVAQGLNPKQSVKCATTVAITLSGTQLIDTYSVQAGDRVLVKNQGTSSENGIYVASSGPWTRAADMDVWAEVPGAYTVAVFGSANANTGWVCTAADSGTIGVTAMPWVQFSGNGTYFAGTGLTLAANTFSITNTGVTANTYGSASAVPVLTVNAQGQLTSVTTTPIAINGNQITSGTIGSAYLSGSYTGITGVGTLTAGTWNASTIGVQYGGTGATTLTGYVKGNGTSAFTASTTVPTTDLSGTITNAQLANSTISGVALGGNLFSLTIGSGLSGTSYNGSAAVTITNSSPMVYPGSGIPNSTGSAWGTSYSTSGSGNVALTTGATLSNPTISNYEIWTSTSAPSYAEGRQWYDSTTHSLAYYNDSANAVVHIGQDILLKVINNTGSTIANGAPVYITSTSSGQTYPNVALAKADVAGTATVIGLTNGAIANGAIGYVTSQGGIDGVNTGTFTVGQVLYLSPYSAGQLMNTVPPTGITVQVGVVTYVDSSAGKIYVKQTTPLAVPASIITGTLTIAQGGTNGTATPTAGAVAYGSGTAYAFTSAGTSGQVLTSNGSSAPTWTTPTAYATVTDDTTTNATRYPLFASVTAGNLTTEYVSSTKFQFNPSTGALTATSFSGSASGLTSVPAGQLTGTIPSTVLGNSTVYIGTTAIALNRSSASQTLTGTSIDGSAASATTATTATNANNVAVTDDTTTNATYYPTFVSNSTGNLPITVSSTKLKFNPSTGALTSSQLIIAP